MKKLTAVLMAVMLLVMCMALTACGGSSAEDPAAASEASAGSGTCEASCVYGYTGGDPVEAAVYRYMAEEVSGQYGLEGDVISVPVVQIISTVDNADGGKDVYGNFQIYNYTVEGETLVCQSGGTHPGKMHVVGSGDAWSVDGFDAVADGADYEPSAREIFGDLYDQFVQVASDDAAAAALRTQILTDYVKNSDLAVTQYQDYGWDPVPLNL